MGPRCVVWREQFTVWGGGWQRQKAVAGWGVVAWGKAKDLTQRAWRKGGGKSEKDRGVYRRGAESAEEGKRFNTESTEESGGHRESRRDPSPAVAGSG